MYVRCYNLHKVGKMEHVFIIWLAVEKLFYELWLRVLRFSVEWP